MVLAVLGAVQNEGEVLFWEVCLRGAMLYEGAGPLLGGWGWKLLGGAGRGCGLVWWRAPWRSLVGRH